MKLVQVLGLGVPPLSSGLGFCHCSCCVYSQHPAFIRNFSKTIPRRSLTGTTSKDRHYASAAVTSYINRKPAIRLLRHRVSAAHESKSHKSHRKWLTWKEYTDILKLKTWKVEILTRANLLQRFSIKSLWYLIDFRRVKECRNIIAITSHKQWAWTVNTLRWKPPTQTGGDTWWVAKTCEAIRRQRYVSI